MAKFDHITGFEFPVFDDEEKIESTKLRLYDYNSLANIPEHESFVSIQEDGNYQIDSNVRVTKNLETAGNLNIGGALTGKFVLSIDSFGDTLPMDDPHVAGRIFFVKLQD